MIREQLCYECAFWLDLKAHPPKNSYIIKGKYYVFSEWERLYNKPKDAIKSMHIYTTDQRVVRSNKIRLIGSIPKHLQDILPNNAHLITKHLYYKLRDVAPGYQCHSMGCYDRYYCHWYDRTIEDKHGAWNIIPRNYIPGSEQCPIYIDQQTINKQIEN